MNPSERFGAPGLVNNRMSLLKIERPPDQADVMMPAQLYKIQNNVEHDI
jgi:hypothetical protein